MKYLRKILASWSFIFLTLLLFAGLRAMKTRIDVLHVLLLFPTLLYFFVPKRSKKIKQGVGVYSGGILAIISVSMLFGIRSVNDVLYICAFIPTLWYFFVPIYTYIRKWWLQEAIQLPASTLAIVKWKDTAKVADEDRRKFLKMLAGAGLGVFVLSFFGVKKAGASFFGSVPGPGVIGVKDSSGTKIDPAIKSPTDGYGVAKVDSSTYPSYYGFVNKDGGWYILCENPQNTFLYSKGNSDFTTNWTGRSGLTYASFDATF